MGNTPSQRPIEGGSSEARDPDAGATVLGRLAGAVRSLAAGLRARCSVLSSLDLGSAFRVDVDRSPSIAVIDEPPESDDTNAAVPARTDQHSKSSDPDSGSDSESTPPLPARDRPFTRPADDDRPNTPDLRARKEDGRLELYYPDREGAEITSDTWQRVER